jgi:long-chain fatty acid transport protein
MKRTIKLAVAAAVALTSTAAFATNGSNLIGLGAKARGMGGVGIGMSHGAESALANPALITTVPETEVSFGGTIFLPNVKNTNGLNLGGLGDESSTATSAADLSVIPEVAIASKMSDSFYMGIGMFGTAGMGTDYRKSADTGQMNMVTNVQIMQFGVPLAYKTGGFALGITPLLQYGSLDINYNMSSALNQAFGAPAGTPASNVGAGVAQDLQFGYNVGASFSEQGLTVGAVYKSQIDMKYNGVMSTTIAPFTGGLGYTNDKLSTPAEMGIGASYAFSGNTIAVDYKKIKWSDAKGYQDFEWDDQDVYAIGYEYATFGWAARVGYNYSKSPISEQAYAGVNGANLSSGVVNTFNLLGFPGIVESHYTLGGTYNITKKTSVDLAYMYAPEVSETYTNFLGQDITTKHSQQSVSAQLNFAF